MASFVQSIHLVLYIVTYKCPSNSAYACKIAYCRCVQTCTCKYFPVCCDVFIPVLRFLMPLVKRLRYYTPLMFWVHDLFKKWHFYLQGILDGRCITQGYPTIVKGGFHAFVHMCIHMFLDHNLCRYPYILWTTLCSSACCSSVCPSRPSMVVVQGARIS